MSRSDRFLKACRLEPADCTPVWLMYENRKLWDQLMAKLARLVSSFLLAQTRAGAQAVQLFDSWVGCLSPADYRDYVLPHTQRVFGSLKNVGVPSIHFGTGTADLLRLRPRNSVIVSHARFAHPSA